MPIDASIISGLKVPQPHALETVGKLQEVQRGILGNRQLGQEIGATEAQGRAVTKNTKDGVTDWDHAAADLSLDPQGAWKAGDFAAQVLKRKTDQIALEVAKAKLTQEQLTTSQAKFKALGDWAATMAAAGAKDPAALADPKGIIANAGNGLLNTGIINPQNPQERDQFLSVMAQFGNDPKKNMEILKQTFLQGHATSEGIGIALGSPTTVDTGPGIQTRQVSPLTGEVRDLGTTQKGLTPEGKAALQIVTDPVTGEKSYVPRGSMSDQGGAPPAATGAPGNGRYPAAKPSVPGAVGVAALAPGVAESRVASATQSATTFQKDVSEAGGYAQRIQGLNKAYDSLVKAETGPGAKRLQDFRAVFDTFGVHVAGSKDKVESYAEAQKYLQDYANRRGSELGIGTDAGRSLVNAANPGVQTPKGAALQVVNVIKGLERMQASQVAAAQAEGVQPDQYAAWRAKWNRSVDPAAFAPPKLDKAGWEAKRKELGEKWPAYKRGLDAALAAGVLSAADLRK